MSRGSVHLVRGQPHAYVNPWQDKRKSEAFFPEPKHSCFLPLFRETPEVIYVSIRSKSGAEARQFRELTIPVNAPFVYDASDDDLNLE
jgi:hypothetical protein